ncbi:glycosyltransferase family 2 protein [Halobacillus amylolyticus]|uniref:Glycosyltransferase family 2 protein n=1 Tax=Halobacillus amylolyticus TaxID=2932259 RepID=A0ABY4HKC1_9BACI|nr:glycosyltransferase family 2 protein [Halobacillus amylolyticus]UOR13970.1 glycosyltransferase family 2 protein [Halobacillus amylolyticus]
MKTLTVFTPTYNRAYCLQTCYESLIKQTNDDFTWLIIDDGSTDETEELVRRWIDEAMIPITYHYQHNQGMHGAHNTAYEIIDTELNVCIDSDDYMPAEAVDKIVTYWKENGSDKVSGIIGLDSYTDQKIIGTPFPEQIHQSTLFDLYNKYGVTGDKKLVYRTELTKHYPYPIFTNEKYVGLAYKYYRLDEEYEMLLMNETLCCVEYLPDGSSNNMLKQYRSNPKGFAFYRKELMKLSFASLLFKYRQAIHYVSSSLMCKNTKFIKESPNKGLAILAVPFGFTLYMYIMNKTKGAFN